MPGPGTETYHNPETSRELQNSNIIKVWLYGKKMEKVQSLTQGKNKVLPFKQKS